MGVTRTTLKQAHKVQVFKISSLTVQVISFDHEHDYVWRLLKYDQRCQVLDEQKYGKVCRWQDNV